MGKGKDFYGKDIAEVIEQACKELGASREELAIEVIETGSAGIFGLCKKKAHIRVQRKTLTSAEEATPKATQLAAESDSEELCEPVVEQQPTEPAVEPLGEPPVDADERLNGADDSGEEEVDVVAEVERVDEVVLLEPPSAESLEAIRSDLNHLLTLMGLPSEVAIQYEDNAVLCSITGPHEEHIVGPEGRTLDSLQYLLRKMVAPHLPDRIMLALNAGNFRERRAEELKIRAVELAELVKADGKTQSIPALNPSERRVVHMVLQEDKGVRSRSVGEGLFKKVLIYKPGKGRRPAPRKKRGGQGGRSSGD